MAIKGVLFDKDGTLIAFDNIWGPIYHSVFVEHFGYGAEEATALLVKSGFEPETGTCRAGSPMAAGTLLQLAAVWWPELPPDQQAERARFIATRQDRKGLDLVEPILELGPVFDQLHAMGLVLGVGTNDTETSAIAHMQEIDVHHYFDVVLGSDSVAAPKPAGLMIRRFAEMVGIAPAEVAMVGDNAHDVEEARAGGAGLAIGVLSGNSAHHDLHPLADHVLTDVAELPSLLRRLV